MQKQVWSLVQEDPTCRGATTPLGHHYWACAVEPGSRNYWAGGQQLVKPSRRRAGAQQQEKPLQWEACAPQPEGSPCCLQLEKIPPLAMKIQHSQKRKQLSLLGFTLNHKCIINNSQTKVDVHGTIWVQRIRLGSTSKALDLNNLKLTGLTKWIGTSSRTGNPHRPVLGFPLFRQPWLPCTASVCTSPICHRPSAGPCRPGPPQG